MINLKNFKRGEPRTEQQKALALSGAWFLFDEEGNEWYESQKRFAPDTMKIAYSENGVIAAIATDYTDVSSLFPDGMSVAEVENTAENPRADITGGWVFAGHSLGTRVYTPAEQAALAEAEKDRRITAASKRLAPLQDAVDLAMASDKEKAQLLAWKKYRILLNRVETDSAPNIDWPSSPAP